MAKNVFEGRRSALGRVRYRKISQKRARSGSGSGRATWHSGSVRTVRHRKILSRSSPRTTRHTKTELAMRATRSASGPGSGARASGGAPR
uniref:Uncharacterized protein n=1 Tax=Human herpesvirus 2 TaxID=10310 RepID=A0A481TM55_HHV2|nr:hypothetical protein [Human alphaherpesvirus 2]QBH78482.1 hypothetical protein [Human alphaherpesvirus 2]QBH79278.1 hypothetical protein [Human alphaherpesvirus 2]QBH79624.1 hypothetical protein [Human alphaherpesvirus 2]QBH79893.1 hypothetical protein [Human alphaherpesvirus 2]